MLRGELAETTCCELCGQQYVALRFAPHPGTGPLAADYVWQCENSMACLTRCLEIRLGKRPGVVGCITCPKRAHKGNMVNVYDGEYQCQECRYGL